MFTGEMQFQSMSSWRRFTSGFSRHPGGGNLRPQPNGHQLCSCVLTLCKQVACVALRKVKLPQVYSYSILYIAFNDNSQILNVGREVLII